MVHLLPAYAIHEFSTANDVFTDATGKPDRAAERLLQILKNSGCKSIVLESEYVDADYKSAYSRLYYMHFRDSRRRCRRLHYFACQISPEDVYSMRPFVKQKYLGYTVLRPLPTHISGRTVLRKDVLSEMFPRQYDTTDYAGEECFATCAASHHVNLAGNRIRFAGVPWMQQDKLVAACATAAIWTANWHMSHLYPADFARYTTTEITDLAVRYSMATGRAMPTHGLHLEQMISAMKGMGYEPLLYIPNSAVDCHRSVYYYIESGIPIIAIVALPSDKNHTGVEYHAVTIVGHTLRDGHPVIDAKPVRIGTRECKSLNTSDFVPRFIAQDDSGGPFRCIDFLDWNEAVKRKKNRITIKQRNRLSSAFPCVVRLDVGTDHYEPGFLFAVLVPLPARVTLDGSAAELNAIRIIEREIWPALPNEALIFRTFLQPSNNLKMWWSPRPFGEGRPPEVGAAIRNQSLPHWVWITEFADPKQLREHKRVLGQILQDSSGRGTHAPWDDVIAIVGPDRVCLFSPDPDAEPQDCKQSFSEAIAQYRSSDCEYVWPKRIQEGWTADSASGDAWQNGTAEPT